MTARFRGFFCFALAMVYILLCLPCPALAAVKPRSVSLNRKSATMYPGDRLTLNATVSPQGAESAVTFTSNNKKVARVDSSGVVTAVAPGKARITVTTSVGKKKARCTITVKPITPSSVTLKTDSTVGKVGEKMQLTATVYPANASNKAVTYKSSNSKIATVNAKGLVTLKKLGDVKITATTKAGKKKTTIALSVRKTIEPSAVKLSANSAELTVGKTLSLRAEVEPSRADNKTVSWKSSNTSVAKVSASGVVTAVSSGSATITATTNAGGKTASCAVNVTTEASRASPNTVALNSSSMTLSAGDKFQLVASVAPVTAADKSVLWSSDKSSVARVDLSGNVYALSKGSATITATTSDGSRRATCKVTVVDLVIPPSSVRLSSESLTLEQDRTHTLSATVSPADATNKLVKWSSSNPTIATVSSGLVRACAPGKATITATTLEGGLAATCVVTVTAKPLKTNYHALLIGQERYSSRLYGPYNDVKILQTVLNSGGYGDIRTKYDLTANGMRAAIQELISSGNYSDNDVTVFFFSGHGGNSSKSSLRGAIIGVDGSYLTVDTVRELLDQVPGQVIVVLDSCLSGQFITTKSESDATVVMTPAEFNQSVVDAFSAASAAKAIPDAPTAGKYVILTAAEAMGYSYSSCVSGHYVGLFTYFFGKGAGYDLTSGACGLMADASGDKQLTLTEMYNYISANIESYMDRIGYSQKTQMWPTSGDRSRFVLMNMN